MQKTELTYVEKRSLIDSWLLNQETLLDSSYRIMVYYSIGPTLIPDIVIKSFHRHPSLEVQRTYPVLDRLVQGITCEDVFDSMVSLVSSIDPGCEPKIFNSNDYHSTYSVELHPISRIDVVMWRVVDNQWAKDHPASV